MKVKALVSFAGIASMGAGEVKDIEDISIVEDLLAAGYVEKAEETVKPVKASVSADDEKTAKKGKKQI